MFFVDGFAVVVVEGDDDVWSGYFFVDVVTSSYPHLSVSVVDDDFLDIASREVGWIFFELGNKFF